MLGVAIDMHLVSCHSKKLGSDLRGGGRKDGTNRFETYTADTKFEIGSLRDC